MLEWHLILLYGCNPNKGGCIWRKPKRRPARRKVAPVRAAKVRAEAAEAAEADSAQAERRREAPLFLMDNVDSVIVQFSTGKDSLALLDLCSKRFERIECYFMYWVRDLSFQRATLEWAEKHYGISIYQVPHFELSAVMSNQSLAWFRPSYPELRATKVRDLEDHVRRHFNNEITWIASGERKQDSLERRAMLSESGPWDVKRLHHYPLSEWSTRQVWHYLRVNRIPIPGEYSFLHRSWMGFIGEDLAGIAKHYPDDYRKILDVFPFADSIRVRYELYGRKAEPIPAVPDRDGQSQTDSVSGIQPTAH